MKKDKFRQNIRIGRCKIGWNNPVFIIAEAGVNHNGSLRLAKRLIDTAKAAGVNAVKFQVFQTADLVTRGAPQAEYQRRRSSTASQFEMLKKLELPNSNFRELFDYCHKKKIIFLATPFDLTSARFLSHLGVAAFKIGSGDLTNDLLLSTVASYGKPLILSTGMSDLPEIRHAVKTINLAGNKKLILLHCTSCYPTDYTDVNLKAMATLQRSFGLTIGYSDHTSGIEAAIAAVALGACVIEKHITLDKVLPGPDQKASLEPTELRQLVDAIRNIERALGDGVKTVRKCELGVRLAARKSIVALHDLAEGAKLRADMLTVKRPGTGIQPKYLDQVIGIKIRKRLKADSLLTWEMLK